MSIRLEKLSLPTLGFLQALGLTLYCGAVVTLISNLNSIAGQQDNKFLAPLLALLILTTSALISALITLGYPIVLFWEKKQPARAIQLVAYTIGWMIVSATIVVSLLAWLK